MPRLYCPRCRGLLNRAATPQNIWFCKRCRGRFVDSAQTENILDPKVSKWLWELTSQTSPSVSLRCPRCHKFLCQIILETRNRPVEVDACKACKALWLDHGELESPNGPDSNSANADKSEDLLTAAYLPQEPEAALESIFSLPIVEGKVKWSHYSSILGLMLAATGVYFFSRIDEAIEAFGFYPGNPTRLLSWVSSAFVHGDLGHLASNLYFFFMIGGDLEEMLGADRFFAIFFLGVMGGNLACHLFEPSNLVPHIGASGGVFALMAAYALRFPDRRIAIARWFGFHVLRFRIPVWAAFVLYATTQLYGYLFANFTGATMVSYLSHLGGAVAGALVYLLLI